MKQKTVLRLTLLILCLTAVLSLCSCTDMEIGDNNELADQFMHCVIVDDYNAAYDLVKATVADPDFRDYWVSIQAAARGAETYELEQIGWHYNSQNGVATRTSAYQVYLDNEHTVLLRVVTQDGIEGIAGIHFSDITDFLAATEAFIPTVRILLWVVSALCIAFTLWMLVDCLRRKMKYKVLWALLILCGVVFTVTVGETANFSFSVGLFFQLSSINADPGIVSVVTKIVVPVGAILYLCLRKKVTVEPPKPDGEVPADPFAQPGTRPAAEADGDRPASAEADTKEGGEES